MNIELLKEQIIPNNSTLIICPMKYRNLLYQKLLDNNQVLFNVNIMDINSFLNSVLIDNNISFDDNSSIISTLKIHQHLKDDNHNFAYNINYLNELKKLEQEFNWSNVEYHENEGKYLNTTKINFNNLVISYDKIIILTTIDFQPIHHELIDSISKDIVEKFNYNIEPSYHFYEHNNTIRMLDYIIFDIYNNSNKETLVICDNNTQKEYIINKFKELGVDFNTDFIQSNISISQLTSLFSIINNDYTEYDISNVKHLINIQLFNELEKSYSLKYIDYLKFLYDILYNLNFFSTDYLNKLFSNLHQFDNVDKELLNKLLLNQLQQQLKVKHTYRQSNLFIMSTDFIDFEFEQVYIVDASLKEFTAKQTSYLLTNTQRQNIDPKLITNQYYSKHFKIKEQALLHCGKKINIHYSLLNLDNKSQNLAPFISNSFNDIHLEEKQEFYHLSIHPQLSDSFLLNNSVQPLNKASLLSKFEDKLTISSSALDAFGKCPYQYFISYILKPYQITSLDAMTLGNIYHSIIEEINNLLLTTRKNFTTISRDDLDNLIIHIINSKTKELVDSQLLETYYVDTFKKQIFDSINNFINSNIYIENYSKYQVSAFEESLSSTLPPTFFKSINIYGKIDAIMSFNDYHYVLDYKSSSRDFSESDFKNGISNQLIIYLYLLKKNNYNITGAFFKSINNNFVTSDKVLDYEYNKQLHIDKTRLNGLLIDNLYIDDFDRTLISESKSTISNVTARKILELEKLNDYFSILEQHFANFINTFESNYFDIKPFSKQQCEWCQYKIICKADNPVFRKEEQE